MRKVTREEWERTPREYRMVKNGQRYMLVRDEERGTVLVPVEVEETDGENKGGDQDGTQSGSAQGANLDAVP